MVACVGDALFRDRLGGCSHICRPASNEPESAGYHHLSNLCGSDVNSLDSVGLRWGFASRYSPELSFGGGQSKQLASATGSLMSPKPLGQKETETRSPFTICETLITNRGSSPSPAGRQRSLISANSGGWISLLTFGVQL